jgi:thiol-disulfide isomerase/thioredoxin
VHKRIYSLALLICVLAAGALVVAQQKAHSGGSAASPAVKEVNAEGLKQLLKRDGAAPKPLLVNFWATWCGPCREEYPDLVKIDKAYKPKGLEFITVTLDDIEDINTKVPEFLKSQKAEMPTFLLNTPEPGDAIALFGSNWSGALPATFLLNRKGEVVYKEFGPVKPAELTAAVEKALSEK